MARGRAFDSDGSGSGPRGGHGRGRSTHGRGGTIPSSSSSSMSGASSSAQPPMPILQTITPADTTAHPVGTPPGDTTLDRLDNQPRRFDFGPF
ncbi:hypothetical protein JCGZ_18593 [Jatropha curcas]|uniref:Uncharacterized protein n=1 Tax=Jatropha curcas TaxID=180498 RepID=A0A067K1B9_JATCU|nr:hypothetical protein JCGZ_18593 [Jatropha curcas]